MLYMRRVGSFGFEDMKGMIDALKKWVLLLHMWA